MMQTITIAPIRKTLRVKLQQARAFEIFTAGIDRWWPRTHHFGASPMKKATIEPFVGGRWYHSCEDGSEIDFGHVLLWQPPERLMLAWETNYDWHYDREAATEVEINFIAESAISTRVELEHRHLECLGDKAEEFCKRIDDGWPVVLECFGKAAEAAAN